MQTYVLVSMKDINLNSSINKNLTIISIQNLQNIVLYKVSNNILKNSIHKSNSMILFNHDITKFNIFNYELDIKQIVIPILNITYFNLLLYLQQYNNKLTLKNIYNILVLNSYFKETNIKYIQRFINNINNSFDSYNYNNFNYEFHNRKFKKFNILGKINTFNYASTDENFQKKYIDISIN